MVNFSEDAMVRLPVHLDVPNHVVRARHYITAVNSLQITLDELNFRLLDGHVQFEFVVLPAEEGTFKGVTGLVVKSVKAAAAIGAVAGGLISFFESDFGEELAIEIFGEPVDTRKLAHDIVGVAKLMHGATVKLFVTENEYLDRALPRVVNFDKIIKAKSDFYLSCVADEDVRGVGFSDEEVFPVKRSGFFKHISKDRTRQVPSEFRVYDAVVISPVDVDKDIKWEFSDVLTRVSIKAYMRDYDFKRKFLSGMFPLKRTNRDDVVKIVVEYKRQERNGEIENKEISVHTVCEFNGLKIGSIPDNMEIASCREDKLPFERIWVG